MRRQNADAVKIAHVNMRVVDASITRQQTSTGFDLRTIVIEWLTS